MRSLFLPLALLPLLASCGSPSSGEGADSCSAAPFAEAKVTGALGGSSAQPTVALTWAASPGEPPETYYAQAQIDPASASVASGVVLTGPHEYTLDLSNLTNSLSHTGDLRIDVDLPDIRDYSSCQHPGMSDTYGFTVTLDFDASHALAGSTVTPIKLTSLGAI